MRKAVALQLAILVMLVILVPVSGQAQSFNGSVAGKVMDTTGAVVANADLVLKNVATGFELRRPTLSLVESQFSEQVWTEEHTKSVMQRFGATYLIVYPGDTSKYAIVQQESPFLAALVRGRAPSWLTLAASNGCATVFEYRH